MPRSTALPITGPAGKVAASRRVTGAGGLLTQYGIAISIVALLVTGSAFRSMRIQVAGLLVHPYLLPAILLFLFVAVPVLGRFPRNALVALFAFLGLYILSLLQGGAAVGEILKIGSGAVTILVAALSVRTRKDFRTATLGLSLAAAIIALNAIVTTQDSTAGLNPLEEIANKNAFSLYALPALLLAAHVALEAGTSKLLRILLSACILVILLAIFDSANRSGWLGAFVIAVMLYARGRRIRATLFVAVVTAAVYSLVVRYGSTDVVEDRLEQTRGGYKSDELRKELVITAFQVGLDHPIMGVGPQHLPAELARRLRLEYATVDPHNVVGHVVGGSGYLTLGVFLLFWWFLWRRPPANAPGAQTAAQRSARGLLRMMLVLYFVRGMFTREILYNPAFSLAVGFAIALCLLEGEFRRRPAGARAGSRP